MTQGNTNSQYLNAKNEDWFACVVLNGQNAGSTYAVKNNEFKEWLADPLNLELATNPDAYYVLCCRNAIYVFGAEGEMVPIHLPTSKDTKAVDMDKRSWADILSRWQMAFGRRCPRIFNQVYIHDDNSFDGVLQSTEAVLNLLGVESIEVLGWQKSISALKGAWI